MLLETTSDGITTSLLLDLQQLERIEYLDELELDLHEQKTGRPDGTRIEVESDGQTPAQVSQTWNTKQLHKLFVELRSLNAPDEIYKTAEAHGYPINYEPFEIKLCFGDFPLEQYRRRTIPIRPYPLLDLYDYKISGRVDEHGNAELTFGNQNVPSLRPETFKIKIPISTDAGETYPGDIFVDVRVYDRDPDSIDSIIKRGLKDPDTGEYLGKQEARRILDEYYGVGVYRGQFRIRPYGEQSFDWLDLDKKRVQNPSYRIGHNQIIGFVHVRSEEQSGLLEKSARDGLVENGAYRGIVQVVSAVINELEGRRVAYRKGALKGGRVSNLEADMDSLFDFGAAKRQIAERLGQIDISEAHRKGVQAVVDEALDTEKSKTAAVVRQIRDTLAVYQGQATLGKITHVLLHEGRKHVKYITETVPRLARWTKELAKSTNDELVEKIEDRGNKVISHAKGLSFLFKKIEPLARTRRAPRVPLDLAKEWESAFAIFSSDLQGASIRCHVHTDGAQHVISANEMDLITVLSNLIENSVFWLRDLDRPGRIDVYIFQEGKNTVVEYKDNGPGFQGGNLGLMFEPGYSMKPGGTGLGLALAGEAMSRIGGRIEAKNSDKGAEFDLTFEGQLDG